MSMRLLQPASKRTTAYCFKRPLEAQWAVFFALLGVAWEYIGPANQAREGYRADFWLPVQHCWLMVSAEHPTEEEYLQAADLAFSTHTWVAIAWGAIGEQQIYAFYQPLYELGYYKDFQFAFCPHCRSLLFACPTHDDYHAWLGFCYRCDEMVVQQADALPSRMRLLNAYNTARKVQFDEEEKPCNHLHLG